MSADAGVNVESALRHLIREIEFGDYSDQLGHRLRRNTALLRAQALLDVHDVLSRGPVDPEDSSFEAALRSLVAECALGEYRDRASANLSTSPAYLEAASIAA